MEVDAIEKKKESHNYKLDLKMKRHFLDRFFNPHKIIQVELLLLVHFVKRARDVQEGPPMRALGELKRTCLAKTS